MLVLTRKRDEQICIGKNVTITIVRLQGGTVRIGIEAPGEVRIRRGELVPGEPVGCGVRIRPSATAGRPSEDP